MFKPVSTTEYLLLSPLQQRLVCSLDDRHDTPRLHKKWAKRACAIFAFDRNSALVDIVRDILANPQLRIIVFDGTGDGRQVLHDFWRNKDNPAWGIPPDHLSLVRQFVDLYDEDCGGQVMQPFWPERLIHKPPKN